MRARIPKRDRFVLRDRKVDTDGAEPEGALFISQEGVPDPICVVLKTEVASMGVEVFVERCMELMRTKWKTPPDLSMKDTLRSYHARVRDELGQV
jgi:hypothetical protein